ncbi:MAG: hypothetical protein ABI323_01885 [Solirubrobacteraceae bacterium]
MSHPLPSPPPSARAIAACWLVWWLICVGLWLWLEDTVVLANLVDGAVAAAVGATGTTLVYAERLVAFDPRAGWALGLWRPLAQFGPDMRLLTLVLVRALRGGERAPGALRAVRFEPTGGPGEVSARCAVATAVGSFAPNTIVLDVEPAQQVMLVHQLVPQPRDGASVDPLGLG